MSLNKEAREAAALALLRGTLDGAERTQIERELRKRLPERPSKNVKRRIKFWLGYTTCWLFGHRWGPLKVTQGDGPLAWLVWVDVRANCRRCPTGHSVAMTTFKKSEE